MEHCSKRFTLGKILPDLLSGLCTAEEEISLREVRALAQAGTASGDKEGIYSPGHVQTRGGSWDLSWVKGRGRPGVLSSQGKLTPQLPHLSKTTHLEKGKQAMRAKSMKSWKLGP